SSPSWAPAEVQGGGVFSAMDAGATDGVPRGPVQQTDVWTTDGTPQGTVKLVDISPPGELSAVAGVFAVNGRAVFFAGRGSGFADQHLFVTDGTPAGTSEIGPVKYWASNNDGFLEEGPDGAPLNADDFGAVGGRVFFRTRTAAGNPQLWTSDGTEAGTVLLKEFQADSPSNGLTIRRIVDSGGVAMFASTNAVGGPQT